MPFKKLVLWQLFLFFSNKRCLNEKKKIKMVSLAVTHKKSYGRRLNPVSDHFSPSKPLVEPSNQRLGSQMWSHIWHVSLAGNEETNMFLFTFQSGPEGETSTAPAQYLC